MANNRKEEYDIQTEFIRYVVLKHPDLLYTISPAGFIMSAGMGMKMTRMGYRKGTPDVIFFEPCGLYHGCFIEFKVPGGTTSESQRVFMDNAGKRGYYYGICFSATDAINLLENYLSW